MSAHRRHALRGAPLPDVRAKLRKKGPYRLAVVFAALGLSAIAGPSVINGTFHRDDEPSGGGREVELAGLPADTPAQGLVYEDLVPAAAGSVCAGAYALDELTCTHGPDPVPAGLRVTRSVTPVTDKAPEPAAPGRESAEVPPDAEIVRDEGGSLITAGKPALLPDAAPGNADFVMGNHDVACAGDGRDGKRVQVVYVHEFGTPSRYTDYVGSIRVWAAGVDALYDASAAETGGSRHIRYVTTPSCRVDVAEVQIPAKALTSFPRSVEALRTLGYNRTDRKYLLFADSDVYCGISTFVADTRAGAGNRNNGGPGYARVDSGCWSTVMAAHQLTHTLGAILRDSPNSTGAGSCTDDHDLLCGPDRSGTKVRERCPRKHENRLDCGHDDYFSINPPKGSYLAKHWNVAQSSFLLRGDGGDDVPDAPGAVVPDPVEPSQAPAAPTPSTEPSAITGGDATDGGGDAVPPAQAPSSAAAGASASASAEAPPPSAEAKPPVEPAAAPVQAVLEVRDPGSNEVRLVWSAAADGAKYQVAVDGAPVATTQATRARLIGLRPDTAYQITVSSPEHRYLAKGSARTAPGGRPAQNTFYVLRNALTGGAMDLYAARSANGTAITLSGQDGDAQQQWKLVPNGDNTFSLRSRATGKCAVPLGGNPVAGTPLVQGDCAGADLRWTLQLSEYGFTLRTAVGDLVAGVGKQRFGALRVLVLQTGDGSRHQSWTAVPG